ncbi:MAG: hypothetical protein A2Y33_03625 [Spirochaetes bacterium GWF1_51_8]|nr:MAG: hypothetical protein A2Y33_03625 [Spirochaetes bacterium GWF1_51_8]
MIESEDSRTKRKEFLTLFIISVVTAALFTLFSFVSTELSTGVFVCRILDVFSSLIFSGTCVYLLVRHPEKRFLWLFGIAGLLIAILLYLSPCFYMYQNQTDGFRQFYLIGIYLYLIGMIYTGAGKDRTAEWKNYLKAASNGMIVITFLFAVIYLLFHVAGEVFASPYERELVRFTLPLLMLCFIAYGVIDQVNRNPGAFGELSFLLSKVLIPILLAVSAGFTVMAAGGDVHRICLDNEAALCAQISGFLVLLANIFYLTGERDENKPGVFDYFAAAMNLFAVPFQFLFVFMQYSRMFNFGVTANRLIYCLNGTALIVHFCLTAVSYILFFLRKKPYGSVRETVWRYLIVYAVIGVFAAGILPLIRL